MRVFVLSLVVFLCCVYARANDAAATGAGGRWRMMSGEHRFIQMKSERVRMVQGTRWWTVTADFVFQNHGPRTIVTMGFPEGASSESVGEKQWRAHSSFGAFASWVDEKPVRVRRVVTRGGSDDLNALWTKQVLFGRGQTRHVRVRYLSGGGGDSNGGSFVSYDFTGGNWRGRVEKSVLSIEFTQSGDYYVNKPFALPEETRSHLPRFEHHGRNLVYTWRRWQAQENFQVNYSQTVFGALHDAGFGLPGAAAGIPHEIVSIPPRANQLLYSPISLAAFWRNGELWASCDWLASGGESVKGHVHPMRWNERKRRMEISRSTINSSTGRPFSAWEIVEEEIPGQDLGVGRNFSNPILVDARGAVSHFPAPRDRAIWVDTHEGRQLWVRAEPLAKQLGLRIIANRAQKLVRLVPLK